MSVFDKGHLQPLIKRSCLCVWVNSVTVQATSQLEAAQQKAEKEAAERSRLEADLAGCKSWIRELERTEQQYLKAIRSGSLAWHGV